MSSVASKYITGSARRDGAFEMVSPRSQRDSLNSSQLTVLYNYGLRPAQLVAAVFSPAASVFRYVA